MVEYNERGDAPSVEPDCGGDEGIGCCAADAYSSDSGLSSSGRGRGSDLPAAFSNGFAIGPETSTTTPRDTAGTPGTPTESAPRPAPSDNTQQGDRNGDQNRNSITEKIGQFMQKLGELLSQFVPQEYMQHVRGVLDHVSNFLSQNLRDLNISQNPDGSTRVGFNFGHPATLPGSMLGGGPDVQLGPQVGFDITNGANGLELTNMRGVNAGDTQINGARFNRGPGGISLTARTSRGDHTIPLTRR